MEASFLNRSAGKSLWRQLQVFGEPGSSFGDVIVRESKVKISQDMECFTFPGLEVTVFVEGDVKAMSSFKRFRCGEVAGL